MHFHFPWVLFGWGFLLLLFFVLLLLFLFGCHGLVFFLTGGGVLFGGFGCWFLGGFGGFCLFLSIIKDWTEAF